MRTAPVLVSGWRTPIIPSVSSNPFCQNITATLPQRSSILLGRPPMLL